MNRIVVILFIFYLHSCEIIGDPCCLSQNNDNSVEFTHSVENSKCEEDNENIRYACKKNNCSLTFEYDILEKFAHLQAINVSALEINLFNFDWRTTFDSSLNKHIITHRLDIKLFYASHNHFVKIPSLIFNYMPNISKIDFSSNLLDSLDSSSFEAPDFNDPLQLSSINCAHNKISKVEQGTFSKLLMLESLDLRNNTIKQIDGNIFENNKAIRVVNLKYNPLKKFDFKIFSSDANLIRMRLPSGIEELDVSCVKRKCCLSEFGDEENFTKLKHFNASGNSLKNITNLLKKLGPDLKTLDLSGNFVGKLEKSMLKSFTQLIDLRLSHTNLTDIVEDTFHYQTKLIKLYLSYNDLKDMQTAAFSKKFYHLERLNLEGNHLTRIDDVNPSNFPQLKELAISGNQFYCSYLKTFEKKWETKELTFIHSNSTRIQYKGIDCNQDNNKMGHFEMQMSATTSSAPTFSQIIIYATVVGILCITGLATIISLIFRRRSANDTTANVTLKYVQSPQIQIDKIGYGDDVDYEDIEQASHIFRPISINYPKVVQNVSSFTATAPVYASVSKRNFL